MRKLIWALLIANIFLAAVVFLPRLMSGKKEARPSSISQPEGPASGPLAEYHEAANIQQAVRRTKMSQNDFDRLVQMINDNQIKGSLGNHLARSAAVTTLLTAAVYGNLTDAQKQKITAIIKKDLDFVETISKDSAELNKVPTEVRRDGFSMEILSCLAVIKTAQLGREGVPIAITYANHPNNKIRKLSRQILKDAGYDLKSMK